MNPDQFLRSGRFEYLDGSPLGLRRAKRAVSSLRVAAGPFGSFDRILQEAEHPEFMTYVMAGPSNYIGHGCSERRVGDRFPAKDLHGIEQVYVVYSETSDFGKADARVVECRLWELAHSNGVPLANRVRPGGVSREDLNKPEARELVREARLLLFSLGCNLFEQRHPAPTQTITAGPLGIRIISGEDLPQAEGPVMELNSGGIQARGFATADGFVVLPGAEFHVGNKKGLDRSNRERRARLRAEADFENVEGDETRLRLRSALICKSAAMAGKALTGAHVRSDVWKAGAPEAEFERS